MSLYTLRSGATAIPEDEVLQFITDLIKSSGTLSTGASIDFAIKAQASPNMTVLAKTGRAYVKGSSGNAYPVILDADVSVTINANSSGNPRIDTVVLYIDKSATPNSDGTGVAKLTAVQGTPGGSPSAPDDSAVQAAIGASNPFIRLANVNVASGATSITSGNITDVRSSIGLNSFSPTVALIKQSSIPSTPASGNSLVYEDANNLLKYLDDSGKNRIAGETDWVPLTDGATVTIDLSKGKKFLLPLMGGNRTLALSNEFAGKDFALIIEQDGTGSRLISQWPQYAVTATITIASPGVITLGIDVPTGTPIILSTTGALPTGLTAGTKYYYIRQSSTTGNLATSLANAQAGTAINTSGSQSGVHTANTQVRWPSDTAPTLTTNKYKRDMIGISIVATGVYEGCVIASDI